jgi:outer membrane immunogenic protein
MKKLFVTTAALALLASPALADDFTGPVVGLSLAYSWGTVDGALTDGTTTFSDDTDLSGFEGGLFAGYRYQFPSKFVFGAEIGGNISNADGSYSITDGVDTAELKFEKKHQFYIDLKPGYVVQDNTLLYGLVGYQNTKFEAEGFWHGTSVGTDDDTFGGLRLGAGIEYMTEANTSFRLQYHYTAYSDKTYNYPGYTEKWDGHDSTIELGLAYNF